MLLLNELLKRWERCFSTDSPAVEDERLFRSLNMANAAAKLPAGADTNLYDVVGSAALWASAFEILYPAKKQAFKGLCRARKHHMESVSLHMFAAPLYRMILTAYLDLKLAPRKTVGGQTSYENFRLDHFESGEYQRNIEAGLSTIMYTPEEYRARRQGDASAAWARGQAIKKAIEEVEEGQRQRRLDPLEEHPVHQRLRSSYVDACR
jgi:hypothetical protein